MIKLEPLTGRHDRSGFDCGVEVLNLWLQRTALQHQGKGISRTFAALPADDAAVQRFQASGHGAITHNTILGFYALASAFVLLEDLPAVLAKKYPRQVPVTRLGRLAVQYGIGNQGLGKILLADAIARARVAAEAVGSAGIVVDAKNEDAARFYARYGFIPCGNSLKLFLTMW